MRDVNPRSLRHIPFAPMQTNHQMQAHSEILTRKNINSIAQPNGLTATTYHLGDWQMHPHAHPRSLRHRRRSINISNAKTSFPKFKLNASISQLLNNASNTHRPSNEKRKLRDAAWKDNNRRPIATINQDLERECLNAAFLEACPQD